MVNYYVFCPKLIGVQTSYNSFKWVFGRKAPVVDKSNFEECLIKLRIAVDNDKKIALRCKNFADRFGDYYGNFGGNAVLFNKQLKILGNIAYEISVSDNTVDVVIGKRYLRYVKYKFMHLHPMYYILFDFVSAMLLKRGYLPIYSSAVKLKSGKTAVMIAPPNTGKSLTSLKLVNDYGALPIAEDVAVTDGERIWSVPYTDTYRNYGRFVSNINRSFNEEPERIDCLYWLSHGDSNIVTISEQEFPKMQIVNDYLLSYAKSPAIDAFCFFNGCFKNTELLEIERSIILKMFANINASFIFENNALRYADVIASL